ncbi:glucosidase II [Nitzschia inconspicua]|uniref:Glucosidase II n=1 Tax=Nitzschia inconspicua TaxID=303405 RepID=A0A9K3LKD1_9STRA|nr:glucosidase II [Nitzschia inconspicua]
MSGASRRCGKVSSTWSSSRFITSVAFFLATSTLHISICAASQHHHVYTDSFPTHDEYDMMALDPDTPHGTPYGGFSRATASRLASLPLKLPDVGEQLEEFEPIYTTVQDTFGRPFVCRVYHEDELDPMSLKDSMYNTPILNKERQDFGREQTNEDKYPVRPSPDKTEDSVIEESKTENLKDDNPNQEGNSAVADVASKTDAADSDSDAKTKPETTSSYAKMDRVMFIQEIHKRLSRLAGLCAQMHPDWWSYEWCYDKKVTQFHINMQSVQVGKTFDIKLEDITSLGVFSERRIISVLDEHRQADLDHDQIDGLDFAEGRPELARVIDTFINGDICPDTGKPRVTESTLRCCSERILSQSKGGVLKNGRPVTTDIMTMVKTTEWSEEVCHYNITLCTPLLCDDSISDGVSNGPLESSSKETSSKKNNNDINLKLDPVAVEKMSIPEVLQQIFGDDGDSCIQVGTGGWWVYEFCPGAYIRQYHETTLMDRISGYVSTSIESEHILGQYIPEDHDWVTKENEWMNVVNATEVNFNSATKTTGSKKGRFNQLPTKLGGNGAYFFQEYTKGDVCDHEDVTDSAVKAGSFGEGGIERSTTVRYSCGTLLHMTVKEDSTCHYIVDISIPTLCDHPLFKAPVTKKQVVKCLPLVPY